MGAIPVHCEELLLRPIRHSLPLLSHCNVHDLLIVALSLNGSYIAIPCTDRSKRSYKPLADVQVLLATFETAMYILGIADASPCVHPSHLTLRFCLQISPLVDTTLLLQDGMSFSMRSFQTFQTRQLQLQHDWMSIG